MRSGDRGLRLSLTFITAVLVLLIAVLAGAGLWILRSMQKRHVQADAAVNVADMGRLITAHLADQPAVRAGRGKNVSWANFSGQVRSLCAMEEGLQYVSVKKDGVTVFREHRGSLDMDEEPAPGEDKTKPFAGTVVLDRGLLDVGGRTLPVVVFASRSADESGMETVVEVALNRDTIEKEQETAVYAITSMFKVAIITVVISFSVCVLLVIWMMRQEHKRELRRREEEHLAFAGVMANGIVHDFRNPMSSLKLDVQMLGRELDGGHAGDTEKLGKIAARVRKTVDRMDKVFEEFLYVSKPPSGGPEPVDLCECMRECLTILGPRIEASGAEIITHFPEKPVYGLVYKASFNRAMINILINAEQFSPDNEGEIVVNIFEKDDSAVVEILDNGPGIKGADRARIFEMFESGRPGGTGLGLFFARTAIEMCNGRIDAGNRPEGGARFRVEVPRADKRYEQSENTYNRG